MVLRFLRWSVLLMVAVVVVEIEIQRQNLCPEPVQEEQVARAVEVLEVQRALELPAVPSAVAVVAVAAMAPMTIHQTRVQGEPVLMA
ncbi:unannotated protein [freshwater metagenome]|uniref:Unannotated protein n=1 Tax=freshwater metagenome TaxID=449393 RepID=A0A6J7E7I2_9ZZZZ